MTERPGTDDDEAPALPEVTVPPWLRTGPAADPSVSTPQPADGPAPGADDAVAGRADALRALDARLAEALADDSPLSSAERSSRDGLRARQVTLR